LTQKGDRFLKGKHYNRFHSKDLACHWQANRQYNY
jgi:hypothetical protein